MKRFAAAAVCAFLLALALTASAGAKIVNLYVYNGVYPAGSFDGSDAVGTGPFGYPQNMDINQETGDVYVGASSRIYHLNSAGVSQPFSAFVPNTTIAQENGYLGSVKVDNSGGATKGRIYSKDEYSDLNGYLPSGAAVGEQFPIGNLGDACGAEVAPDGGIWISNYGGSSINRFNTSGVSSGESISTPQPCGFAMDSQENFYVPGYSGSTIKKYNRAGVIQDEAWGGEGLGGENISVDRSDDHVFVALGDHVNEFDATGALIGSFGGAEASKSYPGLSGAEAIAVNRTSHKVYVGSGSGKVDTFVQTGPITIPDVTTENPSVTPETATLKGTVDPDAANGGGPVTQCNFEWGLDSHYGNIKPCNGAPPYNGAVSGTISGLTTGTTYHFRLTAASANLVQSNGADKAFQPAGPPIISNESVSEVNTDGARVSGRINPAGGQTSWHIEVGETTAYGTTQPVPDAVLPNNLGVQDFSLALTGLVPATTYHYRTVATNLNGKVEGPDHVFKTFPTNPTAQDPCGNAQVRQQTGASLLLDCRAYELVSAVNTGGYDVQSDLIPGQATLAPEPGAPDSVIYSVHFGKIPNTGEPTNLGLDPYVATRGVSGWTTAYVGIPASGIPSNGPFGSPLADSSNALRTFAFGGANLCSPCFGDGSTGIPVRMSDGSLVQGMKGSLNPGPGAVPAGYVARPLSANGTHLVFGSTSKFEPDANAGELAIYDRDLASSTTHVVSKKPTGGTMTGAGIGELDISDNGARILLGQLVSTDPAGNSYWHLYMNVGDAPQTIDLTPGTTAGVLYGGMTGDGTQVYFTTPDKLDGGDTDTSADVYRATVGATSATLARVSIGSGAGNTDGCNPVAGKEGPHWNTVSGAANCSAVALAGGAGVARMDGTIYFLSPEKLDGFGAANGANLFAASPGGAPKLVATVEANGAMVRNAVYDNEVHRYADFQVTPDGQDALFGSTLSLTGFTNQGHTEVYRWDDPTSTLDCASCASTGAAATGDASLSGGLNLADDGRVFFTTSEPLVLRDTNGRKDVYEWSDGEQQLISTGASQFDSGLLSVSSDGVNVYFFTRATLAPQDTNGSLMKIYDAREDGGFLLLPTPSPCAASDECHGAGTQAAPPPPIGTFKGTGGNAGKAKKCKKGYVKKNGKCKKKKHKKHKKKQHKRNSHRGGQR